MWLEVQFIHDQTQTILHHPRRDSCGYCAYGDICPSAKDRRFEYSPNLYGYSRRRVADIPDRQGRG